MGVLFMSKSLISQAPSHNYKKREAIHLDCLSSSAIKALEEDYRVEGHLHAEADKC